MNIAELKYLKPKRSLRLLDTKADTLWRASTLHRCLRLQILQACGIEPPMDGDILRKLDIRTAAHNAVIEWIKGNYPVVQTELFVKDNELRCSGHIDVIIPQEEAYYLIEVKTYAYPKIGASPYWLRQVSFYYDTFRKDKDKPVIPVVLIVTLDGKIEPYEVEPTSEYREVLGILNSCWHMNVLPERTGECKSCPFEVVCTEPIKQIDEFREIVSEFLTVGGSDEKRI